MTPKTGSPRAGQRSTPPGDVSGGGALARGVSRKPNRTLHALGILANAVEVDASKLVRDIRRVRDDMDALRVRVGGLARMSDLLKPKVTELDLMIDVIAVEARKTAAELRGRPLDVPSPDVVDAGPTVNRPHTSTPGATGKDTA